MTARRNAGRKSAKKKSAKPRGKKVKTIATLTTSRVSKTMIKVKADGSVIIADPVLCEIVKRLLAEKKKVKYKVVCGPGIPEANCDPPDDIDPPESNCDPSDVDPPESNCG